MHTRTWTTSTKLLFSKMFAKNLSLLQTFHTSVETTTEPLCVSDWPTLASNTASPPSTIIRQFLLPICTHVQYIKILQLTSHLLIFKVKVLKYYSTYNIYNVTVLYVLITYIMASCNYYSRISRFACGYFISNFLRNSQNGTIKNMEALRLPLY